MSEKTLGQIGYEALQDAAHHGDPTAWTHPAVDWVRPAWETAMQAVAAHVASPDADGSGGAAEITRLRDDVHVDWHMTPAEWDELRGVLIRNTGYEYIGRLEAAGALKRPLSSRGRTAIEPKPAPELAQVLSSPAELARWVEASHGDHPEWVDELRALLPATEQPAPELAAAMAETREVRNVLARALGLFGPPDHRHMRHASVTAATIRRYCDEGGVKQ